MRAAGRELALRVSTLPTDGSEKAVVRILETERAPLDLEQLGLAPPDAARLREVVDAGRGVILATGPTGSGKSSTLHALLHSLDRTRRNVVTLEDPVEYRLSGVTQVQVDPKSGLTVPAALRAVLRQDPDTVMVGEIRDSETARIAMAAAVTGHLVLSTLHTNDAPGALTRLVQMGVPAYLVAGGVSAVVAQRLARRRCVACHGAGCARCDGGLRGRTGVFQLLVVDDALRDAIVAGASTPALRRLSREAGMRSLAEDARRQVAEGRTTPHEILHVTRGDPSAGRPCDHCGGPAPSDAMGCPWCGLPTRARCACGRRFEPGWRWCPECCRPRSSG
jgi:type II secretory ATPase GspE/PulE/Tfp pilus assembly ATPase PilB-like protein